MALPASPPPSRLPGGSTTDYPFGPLADSGFGNPFFYHQFQDDFDALLGATGIWTVSKTTTCTAVHTAGDGGLALLSTAAANNDAVSIQLPAADFTLPQGAQAGKKGFFLVRLQLSDVSACSIVVGLANTTATPMTAVADGLYFQKSAASTVLNLISTVGSAPTTTALPAASYSLVNATNIDLAWYVDRSGNVNVFTSTNMVGYVPQSGTGATLPVRGRVQQITGLTLTTANLNPTIAIAAGAAAIKTLTADFIVVQKER
jgi:hypothetical protein